MWGAPSLLAVWANHRDFVPDEALADTVSHLTER